MASDTGGQRSTGVERFSRSDLQCTVADSQVDVYLQGNARGGCVSPVADAYASTIAGYV